MVLLPYVSDQPGPAGILLKTATRPKARSSPGAELVADDCSRQH